jgi:hypothetical protein
MKLTFERSWPVVLAVDATDVSLITCANDECAVLSRFLRNFCNVLLTYAFN